MARKVELNKGSSLKEDDIEVFLEQVVTLINISSNEDIPKSTLAKNYIIITKNRGNLSEKVTNFAAKPSSGTQR